MFSVKQKREIADKVQAILRETNHPELPNGEIPFQLHVNGAESWSWTDIRNNGAVTVPEVNPWNESQDKPAQPIPRPIRRGGGMISQFDVAIILLEEYRSAASLMSGCERATKQYEQAIRVLEAAGRVDKALAIKTLRRLYHPMFQEEGRPVSVPLYDTIMLLLEALSDKEQ